MRALSAKLAPAAVMSLLLAGCAQHVARPEYAANRPSVLRRAGMEVVLSAGEQEVLLRPANGAGGFQDLLRRLGGKLDRASGRLPLSADDIEQIPRYAFDYGNGGWETRLRAIFGAHLGPNLGR